MRRGKIRRIISVVGLASLFLMARLSLNVRATTTEERVVVKKEIRNDYTVDDLRDLVGMERHLTQKYALAMYEWADEVKALDSIDEMTMLREDLNIPEIISTQYEINLKNFEDAVAALHESMENGSNAPIVYGRLETALYFLDKRNSYYRIGVDINTEYSDENREADIEAMKKAYRKKIDDFIEEYNSKSFVVGELGEGMKVYTNDVLDLEIPFGERTAYEFTESSDFIAIKNRKSAGNLRVNAQFNGTVENIEPWGVDAYMITVSHGKFAKTVYGGVENIKVKVGDEVKQYQKLGVVKPGEITTFYLYIDDQLVNPMLLYGADGLMKLYDWGAENPSVAFDSSYSEILKNEPGEYNGKEEMEIDEDKAYVIFDDPAGAPHATPDGTESFLTGDRDRSNSSE